MPIDRATVIDDTGLGDNGTIANAAFMTTLYDAIDLVAGPGSSVKEFPYLAVGDGVADDTTAVQTAITAAGVAGGTVLFPAGTYLVTSLTGASNTTMQGAGQGVSIIKRKNSTAGNNSIIDFITKSNFIVRDMTLDGNKANQTSGSSNVTVSTSSYDWTIERVTSINAKAAGGYGAGISVTLGANNANARASRIRDCRVTGNDGSGLYLNKEYFIDIEGNIFSSNSGDGISVINYVFPPVEGVHQNISIRNNYCFSNTSNGIAINGFYEGGTMTDPIYGPAVPPTKYMTITGNYCQSNTGYGIVYGSAYGIVTGNTCRLNGSGFLFNAAYSVCSGNVTFSNNDYGIDAGGAVVCVVANNILVADGSPTSFGVGIGAGACQRVMITGNVITFIGAGVYTGIGVAGLDGTTPTDPIPYLGVNVTIDGNTITSNGDAATVGIFVSRQCDRVTVNNNKCYSFSANNKAFVLAVSGVTQHNNYDDRTFAVSASPIARIVAASTTVIPDIGSYFVITGTTGITNLLTNSANEMQQKVRHVLMTNGGSVGEYTQASPPGVTITGGGGSGATGTAVVSKAGQVIGVTVTPGSGYTSVPSVAFSSGTAAGTAIVGCDNFDGREITLLFSESLTVTDGGNLSLNGNLTATGMAATLQLVGTFGSWFETARRAG